MACYIHAHSVLLSDRRIFHFKSCSILAFLRGDIMNIGSLSGSSMSAGMAGVQQGMQNATVAAQQVVGATTSRPTEPTQELAKPMVNLKQSELQVQASAAVIQSSSDTIGTLLDVTA